MRYTVWSPLGDNWFIHDKINNVYYGEYSNYEEAVVECRELNGYESS